MPLTVGLISLGCPKNLVDSEIMIGHLQKAGMTMTPEPELADVMVVNTCAFIDQAKQEAIDAILDIVRARENGAYPENQKLIVAGCLSSASGRNCPPCFRRWTPLSVRTKSPNCRKLSLK